MESKKKKQSIKKTLLDMLKFIAKIFWNFLELENLKVTTQDHGSFYVISIKSRSAGTLFDIFHSKLSLNILKTGLLEVF